MSGHSKSILTVIFSPNGCSLCSGSGDCTVRFWNLATLMPDFSGHDSWILTLSWSPDGMFVASGGMDNQICLWLGPSKEPNGTLKDTRVGLLQ